MFRKFFCFARRSEAKASGNAGQDYRFVAINQRRGSVRNKFGLRLINTTISDLRRMSEASPPLPLSHYAAQRCGCYYWQGLRILNVRAWRKENPMGRKENYQRRNAEIGKMKIVQKIIKKVRERRAKKYSALFENFVPFGSTVLDIGAGRGFIAKNISKKRKAKITLLDVIDFNQINLPFVLYDGKTIPFAAHSFDISLLISVLHHCDKPERILGEAIRVSKSRVIIFEELYENFWQKKLQSFLDILFNLFQLFRPPRENMPFNFKRASEWQAIFKRFNLKIIEQKKFKLFGIFPRALFVLEIPPLGH